MKRLFALFLTVWMLSTGVNAAASQVDFTTGQDWLLRMSPREKYLSLIPPTVLFADYDVELKLPLPQYIYLIDRIMERNPRLQSEEVSNIFASTIYLFEPQNRDALQQMEIGFLKGDLKPSEPEPRLTLLDVLQAAPEL